MRSTVALVVRRWRAEPLVVVLVQLTTLIATVVVAAVPMYTAAVGAATIETAVEEAEPLDRAIELSARVPAFDAAVAADALASSVEIALAGTPSATFVRTDQFRIGGSAVEEAAADLTSVELGSVSERDTLYRSVERADPAAGSAVPVSLHLAAAEAGGLGLGDVVVVERSGVSLEVEVVEFVEPIDRSDVRWLDDELFRDGVVTFGEATTIGPVLVPAEVLDDLDTLVRVDHRAVADPARLDPADLGTVAADLRRAPARAAAQLESELGTDVVVEVRSGLAAGLDLVDARLDAGRPVVSIVLLQVVAVALVAVGLAASIVIAGRARDVDVQRLRGASSGQIVGAAVVEAVALVAPTVVLAPLLARLVIGALDAVGPLSDLGLDAGSVGAAPFVAAAVVGSLAVVLIVAPSIGRSHRRAGGLRLLDRGLDLVLAAGAILAIWRLTEAESEGDRSTAFFGADPVQVIAPALGVLAGAMLALRLVRLGSAFAARSTRRTTSTVAHLASATLVRRPTTVTRVVTVVVLAVATGVLSVVLASSWDRSQRDRADAAVSADVRLDATIDTSDQGDDEVQGAGAAASHRVAAADSLDAIGVAIPVDRTSGSLASNTVDVEVVALGAGLADRVVRSPGGLTEGAPPFAELAAPPSAGGSGLGVPSSDGFDTVGVELDIRSVSPELDRAISLHLLVRDRDGTIHRLSTDELEPTPGPRLVQFSLLDPAGSGTSLVGPIDLVGLDLEVPMQFATRQETLDPDVEIEQFEVMLTIDAVIAATRQEFDLSSWDLVGATPNSSTATVPALEFVDVAGRPVAAITTGVSVARLSTAVLPFRRSTDVAPSAAVPAIVTRSVSAGLGVPVGEVVPVRLDRLTVSVEVVGLVDAVPFATDATRAILVDWATLEDRRFGTTDLRDVPDSVAGTTDEGLVGEIEAATAPGVAVVDRWSVARVNANDPVALSLVGALSIAAIGAIAVAVVVVALSAVAAARERRSDAAALRALGLPSGTVRRAALVEIVPAVVVAVIVAVATAILLAGLVLDEVTIGADGRAAVPPPVLETPLGATMAIAIGVAVFGALCPLVVSGLLRRVSPAEELRAGAPT